MIINVNVILLYKYVIIFSFIIGWNDILNVVFD